MLVFDRFSLEIRLDYRVRCQPLIKYMIKCFMCETKRMDKRSDTVVFRGFHCGRFADANASVM